MDLTRHYLFGLQQTSDCMAIDAAVKTFEDNSERILWLPSITLAYIFTLSGDNFQFALAVAAIGGAQLFRFLMESEFNPDQDVWTNNEWIREHFSNLQTWPLAGIAVLYVIAVLYSLFQLYQHFTHQDIVLVGLAGVWCGIIIVILVNLTIMSHYTNNTYS